MYKINNDVVYYLKDYDTNEDILIGTYNQLINFLVNGCSYHWGKIACKYFEDINCTTKDLSHYFNYNLEYSEDFYKIKQFLFYDNMYRIIDVRQYKQLVFKIFKNKLDIYYKKNTKQVNGETYVVRRHNNCCYYKYRCDPVPYLHNYNNFRKYYKHPKIKQRLVLSSIPEYKEYIHPKEYRFKFYWFDDFGSRYLSKSWKDNCKCRHQWQKHKK